MDGFEIFLGILLKRHTGQDEGNIVHIQSPGLPFNSRPEVTSGLELCELKKNLLSGWIIFSKTVLKVAKSTWQVDTHML